MSISRKIWKRRSSRGPNECNGRAIALTTPLHQKGKTRTKFGSIEHKDVLGKQPRDVVISSKNIKLRLQVPTLEEYVVLSPRLVTPIYPADANLIVSLLDLHPDVSNDPAGSDAEIQILEAGTGHGGLTLHLARAIHAANVGLGYPTDSKSNNSQTDTRHPPPALWRFLKNSLAAGLAQVWNSNLREGSAQSVLGAEHAWRRAVLHTVDVSPKNSEFAAQKIRGFRRGIYMRNIKFHVGNVSDWIERQERILSHAILDLPSSHIHVEKMASALRVDGKLLVFNPSITQINSVVELVKARRLPLHLERVIEMGHTMTGGRPWSVHCVRPRALSKENNGLALTMSSSEQPDEHNEQQNQYSEVDPSGNRPECEDEGWQLVCRPKPGERLGSSGFLAIWSKNRIYNDV
ncbi:MAG: hypothetical protein Q9212_000477 [Teloschistes hypoglaucus]